MRIKFYCFLLLLSLSLSIESAVPLSHKSFYNGNREYERGIFLIVLANQSLDLYLGSDVVGEDFVEFKGILEFEKPNYGESGVLILRKDNPSELPEHDDALEIPILFSVLK